MSLRPLTTQQHGQPQGAARRARGAEHQKPRSNPYNQVSTVTGDCHLKQIYPGAVAVGMGMADDPDADYLMVFRALVVIPVNEDWFNMLTKFEIVKK